MGPSSFRTVESILELILARARLDRDPLDPSATPEFEANLDHPARPASEGHLVTSDGADPRERTDHKALEDPLDPSVTKGCLDLLALKARKEIWARRAPSVRPVPLESPALPERRECKACPEPPDPKERRDLKARLEIPVHPGPLDRTACT